MARTLLRILATATTPLLLTACFGSPQLRDRTAAPTATRPATPPADTRAIAAQFQAAVAPHSQQTASTDTAASQTPSPATSDAASRYLAAVAAHGESGPSETTAASVTEPAAPAPPEVAEPEVSEPPTATSAVASDPASRYLAAVAARGGTEPAEPAPTAVPEPQAAEPPAATSADADDPASRYLAAVGNRGSGDEGATEASVVEADDPASRYLAAVARHGGSPAPREEEEEKEEQEPVPATDTTANSDATSRYLAALAARGIDGYGGTVPDAPEAPPEVIPAPSPEEMPAGSLEAPRQEDPFGDDPEIAALREAVERERDKVALRDAKRQEIERLEQELARLRGDVHPEPIYDKPTALTRSILDALPPATHENRHGVAIIIGNRSYQLGGDGIPAVTFAHNDAEAIQRYVVHTLGYREGNVLLRKDATQAQFISLFGTRQHPRGRLHDLIRPGVSDVFVYYSGHGLPVLAEDGRSYRGYLVPADADPAKVELNGYPLETLYANIAAAKARSVTIFIDACFSGSSSGGTLMRSASPALLKASGSRVQIPNAVVVTAASPSEVASWDEEARLGLLTRHLLVGVAGGADAAPFGDGNKRVTAAELAAYLKDEVPYQARARFGRSQNPTVRGPEDAVLSTLR